MNKKIFAWLVIVTLVVFSGYLLVNSDLSSDQKVGQVKTTEANGEVTSSEEVTIVNPSQDDVINTSYDNGRQAAIMVNNISDDNVYKDTVRKVLNYYYGNNVPNDKIQDFTENLDQRGEVTAENYKNAAAERSEAANLNYSSGRVLALFDSKTSDYDIKKTAELDGNQANTIVDLDMGKVAIVDLSLEYTVDEGSRQLAMSKDVIAAQPDFIYYVDEDTVGEPQAQTMSTPNDRVEWYLKYIKAETAWDLLPSNKSKVRVAIIDTGVRTTHEDLANVINLPLCATIENGVKTIGRISDQVGHGTHVTGTLVGEANNGKGICGVASGFNGATGEKNYIVDVIVIDAQTSSGFQTSDLIMSIDYAVENKAKIINLSLGGAGHNELLARSIRNATNKGALVVTAGGNDGLDTLVYPADLPEVIGVINIGQDGVKSNMSNFGVDKDISAPGVNIYSTVNNSDTSYGVKSGTSMATPIVSGVAAMVMYTNPGLTPKEVKNIIYSTTNANDFTPQNGFGAVDANGAVTATKSYGTTNPTKVLFNRTSATVAVDNNIYIEPKIEPSTTNMIDLTWTSSNTSVATVSGGTVLGVSPGTAVITGRTSNGITGSCQVTVVPKYIEVTSVPFADTRNITKESPLSSITNTSDGYKYTSSYMNGYVYKGVKGETLTVTASSTAINTYVKILDDQGNCVAKNDDDGSETNSKVVYTITASGNYYIEVSESYRGVLKQGQVTTNISSDKPAETPAAPGKPSVTATSSTSVTIDWAGSKDASGYSIYRKEGNGDYQYVKSTRDLTIEDTGLTPGATYGYKIAAYRWIGSGQALTSPMSEETKITLPSVVLPSIPSNLVAKLYSSNSVALTWSPSTNVSGYSVYRTVGNGQLEYLGSTRSTSYIDSNLAGDTKYSYQVLAYRWIESGKSVSSSLTPPATVTTPPLPKPTDPPETPTNVVATPSYTSATISWSPSPGASGYSIYKKGADGSYGYLTSTQSTSITDTGLAPSTKYSYKVLAYKWIGGGQAASSPLSSEVTFVTMTSPPPGVPTNVYAVATSSSTITLTWSPVGDASGYNIYRRTTPNGSFEYYGSTRNTYFYDSGLTSGNTYYYRVSSYKWVGPNQAVTSPTSAMGWATP